MLRSTAVIVILTVSVVFSQKTKVGIVEEHIKTPNGEYENELISIELKKPNKDIKLTAQVRIHLIEGHVHVHGHPVTHNAVTMVHMNLMITELVRGVQKKYLRPVTLRVLVQETKVNGIQKLVVEEEFITISGEDVEQFEVKQIVWESMVRKPVTIIKLVDSKIHKHERTNDKHVYVKDKKRPHHPDIGYQAPEDEDFGKQSERHNHQLFVDKKSPHHPDIGYQAPEDEDFGKQSGRHYHHCHHLHHHFNESYVEEKYVKVKCWYGKLGWKAKISLFSLGFFGLLTIALCCCLFTKRRQRRRELNVTPPMDDTVSVDMDDVKKDWEKERDGSGEFHFQFDNSIVIDDKKALVEEA